MKSNTSISLGKHFTGFVNDQVTSGRFASASEVVRAALRLLEEREAHLEVLRAALIEGEESGTSDRSMDEIFDSARARHQNGG